MTDFWITLTIVTTLGGFAASFFLGKRTAQKQQSDKQAKDYKNEAKKWANSGAESVIDRLRRLAKERDNS